MRLSVSIRAALAVFLLFTGCSEETAKKEEAPVRAIKSMVVKERAKDQLRRISGIVEADKVTDLSFEISGQLVKLNVEIGDPVVVDSIIAMLDAKPCGLKVETAKGELESAQATLDDAVRSSNSRKPCWTRVSPPRPVSTVQWPHSKPVRARSRLLEQASPLPTMARPSALTRKMPWPTPTAAPPTV